MRNLIAKNDNQYQKIKAIKSDTYPENVSFG